MGGRLALRVDLEKSPTVQDVGNGQPSWPWSRKTHAAACPLINSTQDNSNHRTYDALPCSPDVTANLPHYLITDLRFAFEYLDSSAIGIFDQHPWSPRIFGGWLNDRSAERLHGFKNALQ
jgi:hypothetical protein